jgi:surface protein
MGERVINPIHNVFKQYRKVNLVDPYSFSKPFESTWNTENLSPGSSVTKQVKLPLVVTGSYNFTVSWGDGTSSNITAWNQAETLHTYSVAGIYTIKITGTCIGWQFNNTLDRLKILTVTTWGNLKLGTTQGSYFWGCANLNLSGVTDILDLAGVTTLQGTFASCTALTTINRINEWNTSSVTNMSTTFSKSYNFNSDIGNWNVSNVTTFIQMFECLFTTHGKFDNGGSESIGNWTLKSGVGLSTMFANTNFNRNISGWAVTGLNTSVSEMFSGCNLFNQNLGSWNVSSITNFERMFLNASNFNNGGSPSIGNWTIRTNAAVSMTQMFNASLRFNQDISSWNISRVQSANHMFSSATDFNNGLASGVAGNMFWDFTSATTVVGMFSGATSFNQNLGVLNLSNCTKLTSMFSGATKFNNGGSADINGWTLKTNAGVVMDSMFSGAILFNQPINSWNTSSVTNMASMFQNAQAFNQNLNLWNTGTVTSMSAMFVASSNVSAFNNGLASGVAGNMTWDVSNVTTMNGMFDRANSFNQNIGSWNVSKVVGFTNMFATATKFNNGGSNTINNWILNSSSNIDMSGMFFQCSIFNQPLNNWNTGRVVNTSSMFSNAVAFNQNISTWNVSNVTNMSSMFAVATAFNQDIGSWNISNVTNFSLFLPSKTPATFSTTNLDSIYNGWSSRPVKPSIVITFGTAKYTAASSAGRAILTGAPNNWVITDGGI